MKNETKVIAEFFHPVSDEWHPNFPGNLVDVSVFVHMDNKSRIDKIRITIWGDDDFGMEKEIESFRFETPDKIVEVKKWLKKWPAKISQKWAKQEGFENA